MNTKTRKRKPSSIIGELFLVLIIIAVLVGLFFPAYSDIPSDHRDMRASVMASQLKISMNFYTTDYGQFPKIGQVLANGDRIIESDADWLTLCALLNGAKEIDDQSPNAIALAQNPRETCYLSFSRSDFSSPPTFFQPEITHKHVITPYEDADGNRLRYIMVFDGNYDNVLEDLPTCDGEKVSMGADVAVYVLDPDDPTRTLVNTYQ